MSTDDLLSGIASKAWKTRLESFESLARQSDPINSEFQSEDFQLQCASESNAFVLELSTAHLLRCAKLADQPIPTSVLSKILPHLAGKPRTKDNVTSVYLLSDINTCLSVICSSLPAKQAPKFTAASLTLLHTVLQASSPTSPAQAKEVVPAIKPMIEHADGTVRAAAKTVVVLLARRGRNVSDIMDNCKESVKKELQDQIDVKEEQLTKVPAAAAASTSTSQMTGRAAAATPETHSMSPTQNEADEPEPISAKKPVKSLSLSDVLSSEMQNLSSIPKWQDKLSLLTALAEKLHSEREEIQLSSESVEETLSTLAERVPDSNINVAMAAVRCMGLICLGTSWMGSNGSYKKVVLPPLLDKLKERKITTTDKIAESLDMFFAGTDIREICEDVAPYLMHKNPQVREGTLKFAARALRTTSNALLSSQLDSFAKAFVTNLSDSTESVRSAAAECFALLRLMVGLPAMRTYWESLDDTRQSKVEEFRERVQIKCNGKQPAQATNKQNNPETIGISISRNSVLGRNSPIPAKARASPSKSMLDSANYHSKQVPRAPAPSPKKPIVKATSILPKPSSSAVPSTAVNDQMTLVSDPMRSKFSEEDALAQATSLLPSQLQTGMQDSNWKVRLETVSSLASWLGKGCEGESVDSEIVSRYLSRFFSEKNFQVLSKIFGLLEYLAKENSSWTKMCASIAIPTLTDKLGDIKLKVPSANALTAFCEANSLQFVLSAGYDSMAKQKAPKAQADALGWIETALADFGTSGVNIRELINFLKVGLKSSNASVRSSATKTLVMLKLFVGADIKAFLEDLNPQLLTTIDSEFAKVDGREVPVATRSSKDLVLKAVNSSTGHVGGPSDALSELFPAVDLDKIVKETSVMADSRSDSWKVRKESLESLKALLEIKSNCRLKPQMGDITSVLKSTLGDTNAAIRALALQIISLIAQGMGRAFNNYCRNFIAGTCAILSDQKASVRAGALTTLSSIAAACSGLDSPLISSFALALENNNPVLRGALTGWLADCFDSYPAQRSTDLSPLVTSVLTCLEDRNGDVRKSAQRLLPAVISSVGGEQVLAVASSLKPASRATIIPLIQTAIRTANKICGNSDDRPRSAASTSSVPANFPQPKSNVEDTVPSLPAAPMSRPKSSLAAPAMRPLINKGMSLARKPLNRPTSSNTPPVPSSSVTSHMTACFISNDPQHKKSRQSRDHTRGQIDADALHSMFDNAAAKSFTSLAFSKNHHAEKDYISALSILANNQNQVEIISNLDLILRYVALRLEEKQTSITLKCLDVVEHIIAILDTADYRLNDQEAISFLPSWISKLGDSKETIRLRVRGVLRVFGRIHAAGGIVNVLLSDAGAKSKNARARAEALDEIGHIISRDGVDAMHDKGWRDIASMIGDRDANVRASALSAISEAYKIRGVEIWGIIGNMPDKDRSMLEERLKRVATGSDINDRSRALPATKNQQQQAVPAEAKKSIAASPSKLPSRSTVLPLPSRTVLAPVQRSLNGLKNAHNGPLSQKNSPRVSAAAMSSPRSNSSPSPTRSPNTSQTMEGMQSIAGILSDDHQRSVEALKTIQGLLESPSDDIVAQTDRLMANITSKMLSTFEALRSDSSDAEVLRLAKHLIATCNAFVDHPELAASLSAETLRLLLEELTLRLLQTAETPGQKDLSRFINLLLLRLFQNGNLTTVYSALFELLGSTASNLRRDNIGDSSPEARLPELILKCVWKIARNVKEDLAGDKLEPARLLVILEVFLQRIPAAEWRERALHGTALGDMPLRTVKTIVQGLCGAYGEDVYSYLSSVSDPENSAIHGYLYRILNKPTSAGDNDLNATKSSVVESKEAPKIISSEVAAPSGVAVSPDSSADNELNEQLRRIFDLIASSDGNKVVSFHVNFCIGKSLMVSKGIPQLYEYQKRYPHKQARIEKSLKATGDVFERYVRRVLARLANDEREKLCADTDQGSFPLTTDSENPPKSPPINQLSDTNAPKISNPTLSASGGDRLSKLHNLFGYSSQNEKSIGLRQTSGSHR